MEQKNSSNRFLLVAILTACLLMIGLRALAESRVDRVLMKHEVRVGISDMMSESVIWHNPVSIPTYLPESYVDTYKEDYQYSQHLWAEYQYRINTWFSFGVLGDVSECHWANVTRNGLGTELGREKQYFYNLLLMPTIRFTYFHHEYVNIFSAFGFGACLNGGTETNTSGKKLDVGGAAELTVLGVSANYKRYFATVEVGGTTALRNTNTVFMLSSRIVSASIGVRF